VRLNQELARSNAELERFAAVASHDLVAPLRAIDKAASWIEEDDGARLSADSRDALAMMRRRVAGMESLVRDLLGYARAGGALEAPRDTDLAELAGEVSKMIGVPEGFEVSVEGSVPPFEAHTTPLRTVLLNLVANALEHHDGPPGRVDVRLAVEGQHARIEVVDDGPGIPASAHERIFALFETADPARSTGEAAPTAGGGLGLAVVRRIVEAHGGHVEVDSSPGHGATFRVLWPRRPHRSGAPLPLSGPTGGDA
jgi:signal transduction histidine kinase